MTTDEALKALEIYPDDIILLTSLGKLLVDDERNHEAEKVFRRVMELDDSYSAVYKLLGKLLVAMKRPADARQIFKRGMEVAQHRGDLQSSKEMGVFLKRLE